MPSLTLPLAAALTLGMLLVGKGRAETPTAKADPLAEVQSLLVGDFTTVEQARADKEYVEVQLHLRAIWADRPDGPWIYVEQALVSALDKPYRQRIYQLARRPDGKIESRVYTFENPLRLAGAWKEPQRFSTLGPTDLKLREGCAVILERAADGSYQGATEGKGCASDLRGAAYATSVVTLRTGEFVSWDRGFDASDVQVWGAKKGAYIFRRFQPAVKLP